MGNLNSTEWLTVICIVGFMGTLFFVVNDCTNTLKEHEDLHARTSWDCSAVDQKDLLSYEKACMADRNPYYCQTAAKERFCKKVVTPKKNRTN